MAEIFAIRDRWAQIHATEELRKTYNVYAKSGPGQPETLRPLEPGEEFPEPPPLEPGKFFTEDSKKIAIVGAGSAGLFTAMLVDYLNKHVEGFHVDYDIFESSDSVGGRLFTYDFASQNKEEPNHHYYDVGAMRFPENPIMKRTFKLFEYLGMEKYPDTEEQIPIGSLRPYYMQGNNEPWCFNNKNLVGKYSEICKKAETDDPFNLSSDPINPIDPEALKLAASGEKTSPETVIQYAIKPWVDALVKDAEKNTNEGWKSLMQIDNLSTTEFLTNPPEPPGSVSPDSSASLHGYNYNTIEWLETFNGGSNWYDQAHSETVLEFLDFSYPSSKPVAWWCIEGGAQVLAKKMLSKVAKQNAVQYNTRITGIDTSDLKKAKVQYNGEWHGDYAAVFNSTTLGAMQQMDLRSAGLKYGQKQAIRSLGYGASAKVGMMFSEPWWRTKFNITEGGIGHSDISTRTTVYPSYNNKDPKCQPAALLCSYTWQQDAQRISTLISSKSKTKKQEDDEAALKELVLWDLALLHANNPHLPMSAEAVYKMIKPMCQDFYAHDWYHDPNTFGAFAFFRPQQFRSMWPYIIASTPSLVLIGEHASNHHAWVVGALESAVFGMHSWLQQKQVPHAEEAQKAMESWKQITKENPFGSLPPWLAKKESKWRAILSLTEHQEFRRKYEESLTSRAK